MRPLLTVRGVYDGKVIKVLPTELLPLVARKVPVAILFLEDTQTSPEENETPERLPFIFNERIVLNSHLKNSLEEE
jgi:hypothetical protein